MNAINTKKGGEAVQLKLFDDVVPIPECSQRSIEIWGSPERVAELTLEGARTWKRKHPGQDVMQIIPPDWKEYIKANL